MEKDDESYELIGKLAIGLHSQGIRIRLTALKKILNDKGADYSGGIGMGAVVSAANRYWEEKDPVIAHAIAYAFTGQNDGYLA
jgi:hypothetical protein